MDSKARTIPLDPKTVLFYKGANAGSEIRDAHADFPFPNRLAEVSLFWFYAGAKAVEASCTTAEDLEAFMLGAATRKPDLHGEEDGDDD